jgi:hypothetical protein
MKRVVMPVAAATVALVAGCGGSHKLTTAQSHACWEKAITAYANAGNTPGGATVVPYLRDLIVLQARAIASHQAFDPGNTTPANTGFVQKTLSKCGRYQ